MGEMRQRWTDTDVLEELYRSEYVGMVRLAYTIVGDGPEAEDVVQECFVEVSRRLDGIRSPGAYLRTAVVSRCHSVLRHRKVVAKHQEPPPGIVDDQALEMWDALDRLTHDQRIAVVLRHYAGWSPAEISDATSIPAATVRSHLRRGLSALRKELTS